MVFAEGDDVASAERTLNLAMQCSIQAQLSYYNEFKNELQSRWLGSFLGHEHLEVKRVSARGGGVLQYVGLEKGLRVSWREYVQVMLRTAPQRYNVSYAVGTADLAGLAPTPTAPPVEPSEGTRDAEPVLSASASRRANPYLQKQGPTLRTYTEVIEPRRVARGLLQIFGQITNEWREDLLFVANEGGSLRAYCHAEECSVDTASQFAQAVAAAKDDPLKPLPDQLGEAYRAARMTWTSDFAEASTPFRAQNFDLLSRAVTREAALATLSVLNARPEHAGNAAWLQGKLSEWLPRFERPSRLLLANVFLVELLQAGPTAVTVGDRLVLTDPSAVAAELFGQRERIAAVWSEALAEEVITPARTALLAEEMEEQLRGTSGEPT